MGTLMTKAKQTIAVDIGKWVLCLGVSLGIYLIPLSEVFTREIRWFLAISVLAILTVAFDFFNVMVPAILMPIGFLLANVAPAAVIFSPWSQTLVYVIIGAFLLARVMEEVGLLKRIAYWCIVKSGGSFKGTVWGVFLAGLILGTITFGNAYVLMAALCYGICKALDLGKSMESAVITMVGCISAVSSRMFIYTPFSISLLENGGKGVDPDFQISIFGYLWHNLPMLGYCVVFVALMLILYKPKKVINGKAYFEEQYAALGPISLKEKKAAILLIILIVYLMTNPWHKLPLDYGFILIPWLAFFPGFKISSGQAIQKMDFPMIFFIVACLSIGTVSGALGIGKLVADTAIPMLMPLGTTPVLLAVLLMGMLLNFLLTPLAILAAFSNPVAHIAQGLGMSLYVPLYTLMYSTEMVVFPYEYVPQLIFFSFGMMKMGDFVKISCIKIVLCFLFLAVVMVPWWRLIGLL